LVVFVVVGKAVVVDVEDTASTVVEGDDVVVVLVVGDDGVVVLVVGDDVVVVLVELVISVTAGVGLLVWPASVLLVTLLSVVTSGVSKTQLSPQ